MKPLKGTVLRRWVLPAGVRLYRVLLWLLPPEFRRGWGEGMWALFARRSVAACRRGGWRTVASWWLRAGADLALTAGREWGEVATRLVSPGAGGGRTMGGFRGLLDTARVEAGQAVRSLARSPGFAAAVVVVLGVGVGANAAMFELVDRLLLRPPAFLEDPATVHRAHVDRRVRNARVQDLAFSYPLLRALARGAAPELDVTGTFNATLFVARGDETPRPRAVKAVTGGYFDLFDARPVVGRFLGVDDDRVGAAPTAVLSHAYWSTEMGGDPGVVGGSIRIGERSYSVVGVAPPDFLGEDLRTQVAFVPMAVVAPEIAGPDFATRPFTTWIELLVRRPPDLPVERAGQRLQASSLAYWREAVPDFIESGDPRIVLAPVLRDRGPYRSDTARVGVWLLGMSVVVLLVASINVSILMLGRALRRRRDAAVRVALGVGRGRLLAGPLLESALLAGVAAALAVPAARAVVHGVARVLLPPGMAPFGLSSRSLAVAMGAVVLVALLTAAAPVASLVRYRPGGGGDELRGGSRGGRSRRSARLQGMLVGTQAAFSAVLLLAAGLFVRSLERVSTLELGYDAERVLLVAPESRNPAAAAGEADGGEGERRAVVRTLRDAAASTPGVAATALTATVPFWRNSYDAVYLEDGTRASGERRYATHVVSHDYFRTMGTPILRGRPILESDGEGAPPVMVVSESMARAVWPGEEALGRCLRLGADTMPCSEVVGIAADIRRGELDDEAMLQFYAPWPQYFYGMPRVVAVRTEGRAAGLVEPLRRRLQDAVGEAAYVRIERLEERVDIQTRSWRLGAAVFGAFGVLALLLSGFGLFSVVAYDVSQRRHELGVRAALGARARDLVVLVTRKGLPPALVGLAAGLALAWTLGQPAEALLFQVTVRDLWAFGGAAGLLTTAAVAATLLPGLRAARTEPRTALDGE